MAEAILSIRAECRSCGWIGMGHERKARYGSEALFCPKCSGVTKSWVVDVTKEQDDLDRLKAERLESLLQSNQKAQQSRLAHERLRDAKRQTERARHRVAMLEPGDPGFSAKQALLAAEGQEAAAGLACAQATKALG